MAEWPFRPDGRDYLDEFKKVGSAVGPPMLVSYADSSHERTRPLRHAKPGDAGYDLYCSATGVIAVPPHEFRLVPAGVSVKIPDGHVGLIKARSSTFGVKRLFVVESVIDSGYVGPMWVTVWNPGLLEPGGPHQPAPAVIEPGDRVAQLLVVPFVSPTIEVVDALPATQRGSNGFGSSGR